MALFKILKGNHTNFENKNASNPLYNATSGKFKYNEGYCYFINDNGKLYVDIGTGESDTAYDGALRKALNAERADCDSDGNIILSTYIRKEIDASQTIHNTNANNEYPLFLQSTLNNLTALGFYYSDNTKAGGLGLEKLSNINYPCFEDKNNTKYKLLTNKTDTSTERGIPVYSDANGWQLISTSVTIDTNNKIVGNLTGNADSATRVNNLLTLQGNGTSAGAFDDSAAATVNVVGSGATSVTGASGKITVSSTDTKNTAGSTDTSSKIFLVGATSQAANPQTYSDNQVYATDGQLNGNSVRVAEVVSLVYDSTNKCLNFNFA